MEHHYLKYSAKEFANDPYFWSWATGSDATSDDFWQKFMQAYPHKLPEIEEAKKIVVQLNDQSYQLDQQKVHSIWQEIRKQNPELTEVDKKSAQMHVSRNNGTRTQSVYQWAASISAIVMVLAAYLIWQQFQFLTLTTAYGETRHVWLPDSSEVVLNANTTIKYKENWEYNDREVWIEGEAFFSVQHLKNHKKFTVHSDAVHVQVLGTEFTVNNRREKTKVMLKEGKVRLKIEEPEKEVRQLEMNPGDLVEYTPSNTAIVQKIVNPEQYVSWTRNELDFDHASLGDIFRVLEDNYGYTLQIDQIVDLDKQFTGKVPADKVDILLEGLRKTHNLNISRQDRVITVLPGKI